MKLSDYVSYLVIILTFFGSVMFDKSIIEFISEHRSFILNTFFVFMTNIGTYTALLAVVLTIIFWLTNKKQLILPTWLSLGISLSITYSLKYIIQRPRPSIALGLIPVVVAEGFSFPSAHATVIFALYPILKTADKKLSLLFLVIVLLVAFSRLYLGVHYLSDIIAGSLIGYLVGHVLVNYFNNKTIFKK